MEIIKTRKTYDAVIIGSGAGGGMSANILAENGLNVAIIEAGPFLIPRKTSIGVNFAPHGNRQEEGLLPLCETLVIGMQLMAGGILKVNLILKKKEPIFGGFDQEC